MSSDRRPTQIPIQPPAVSRIDVTVNVVVSGTLVVEFRSTSDAADLKRLTDKLTPPTGDLQSAVDLNPVPKP